MNTIFFFNFDFYKAVKPQKQIKSKSCELTCLLLNLQFQKCLLSFKALLIKSRLQCIGMVSDHCRKHEKNMNIHNTNTDILNANIFDGIIFFKSIFFQFPFIFNYKTVLFSTHWVYSGRYPWQAF